MASLGARVLQSRSVELAMAQQVPLRVLSSFTEPSERDNGRNRNRRGDRRNQRHLTHNKKNDGQSRRSQRDANTNLARALLCRVGQHTV